MFLLAPAMAADDELDDLLSGLESAAPPASNSNVFIWFNLNFELVFSFFVRITSIIVVSSDAQGAMDELDMLTADLGGGSDYSSGKLLVFNSFFF